MESTRKLRRGLGDVSFLFAKKGSPETEPTTSSLTVLPETSGIPCICVCHPVHPEDSLLFSSYLASRFISEEIACTLVSVDFPLSHRKEARPKESLVHEPAGGRIHRLTLPWTRIEKISTQGPFDSGDLGIERQEIIFLDFDFNQAPYFPPWISVMDHLVLLLTPSSESLTENFRLIKRIAFSQKPIEIGVLFESAPRAREGEGLFEKFSELVSRRLGIRLNWLGSITLPRGNRQAVEAFDVNQLLFPRIKSKVSLLEKKQFIRQLREMESGLEVQGSSNGQDFPKDDPGFGKEKKSIQQTLRLNRAELEDFAELGVELRSLYPAQALSRSPA